MKNQPIKMNRAASLRSQSVLQQFQKGGTMPGSPGMYENSEIVTNHSLRSGKSATRLKPISGNALAMSVDFKRGGDSYATLAAQQKRDQLILDATGGGAQTMSHAKIPKKQQLPPLVEKDSKNPYSTGYNDFDNLIDKPDKYVMSRVLLGPDAQDTKSQVSREDRKEMLT